MTSTEHSARHRRVWGLCRRISAFLVKIKFNFSAGINDPEGPYLVLSNHVTDWDPLMVGASFRKQMYFVASEHVYRLGFRSRLLRFFFSPIARQKGGNAAGTVKTILRTLKDGFNVCLFPEGNRTWDGRTGEFPESTGKLVRASGVSLVTYRLRGGYFSSPRWAGKSIRRGRMTGNIIGVYTPEQLRTMTVSQINELITRDLAEDAYAEQARSPVAYRGKNIAEHIETLLFACPVCGKLHTVISSGSKVACSACGAEAEYLDTGYLRGGFGFTSVSEWVRWQDGIIRQLCEEAGEGTLFSDDEVEVLDVESGKNSRVVGRGRLKLFRDRIELPGGISIPGAEIGGMSIRGDSVLFIGTSEGKNYQLRSGRVLNAFKYIIACRRLGFIRSFV